MFSKLRIFSVSSAASAGSEHTSNETFQSYLCGAGPAPDISSLQLLAVLGNSRFPRRCTESPIPKEKVWRLHKGWDLFRSPNLSLIVHCLQASKCSLSTSQPCRYAMEGRATMLTLPRVLPAQLPGVGKDTEAQGSLTESAPTAEATWQ